MRSVTTDKLLPDLVAFGFSLFGVESNYGIMKIELKLLHKLWGEGDFGDEENNRARFLELV